MGLRKNRLEFQVGYLLGRRDGTRENSPGASAALGEGCTQMLSRTDIERLSDEALVVQVQGGEKLAFEILVERYQGKVYGLALRLARSPEDAEEILQETFLQVFRNLGSFRGEAKFSTWLYRIATNAVLMRRRSDRLRKTESLESFLPAFNSEGRLARMDLDYGRAARADALLEAEELRERIKEAIERLPELYREAFVLHDLEGLSSEDAAEVLELSPDLLRTRLHRARLMMRGYLGHLVGGEK